MQESQINALSEEDLTNYITNEIYQNLNSYREMLNVSKFYKDDAAELAIKDYFFYSCNKENQLTEKLAEKKCVGKIFNNILLNKQFQMKDQLTNYLVYKNFSYLFEENSTNKKSVFMTQDCYTHIGIGIYHVKDTNTYQIYCVLSQKSICADDYFATKDGIIIRGQMLEPNCYLFGVQLVKNRTISTNVGPARILFYKDTGKFTIAIPNKAPFGTGIQLGMRKVQFYVQNSTEANDIPYMNQDFNDNNVPWDKLELALVLTVNFGKLKEYKNETMDKYLTADNYSFSNNNNNNMVSGSNSNNVNINVNSNNLTNMNVNNVNNKTNANNSNVNLTNVKQGGLAMEFDMGPSKKFPPNDNNSINAPPNKIPSTLQQSAKPGGSSFFNPGFLSNKNTNQKTLMNTIPEENSILLSETNSIYNSLRKLNQNHGVAMSSNKTSAFNTNFSMIDNNQLKNNLGNKLQQAELMRKQMNNEMTNNNNQQWSNMNIQNNLNPNPSNNQNPFIQNQQMNHNNNQSNIAINNFQPFNRQNNSNHHNIVEEAIKNSSMKPFNSHSLTNNRFNQNLQGNNITNNMGNNFQTNNPIANNHNQNQNFMNNNNNYINQEHMNNNQNFNQNSNMRQSINHNNTSNMNPMNQMTGTNTNPNRQILSFNHVTSVSNVPLKNNIKSLLDLKLNNTNTLTQNNLTFNSLALKDSNFHVDLTKISSLNNNMQHTKIIPQSRKEFAELIEKEILIKHRKNNLNLQIHNKENALSSLNKNNPINNNIYNSIQSTIHKNNKFDIRNNLLPRNINTEYFPNKIPHLYNTIKKDNSNIYHQTNKKEDLNLIMNKSSVKFGMTALKEKIDKNIYTIDYFIFKDALNNNAIIDHTQNLINQNKIYTKSLPQIQAEDERVHNNKILETLSRRYLNEKELSGNCNNNPVFEELYRTMSCYDIIITVKGEDITAHKVVLISQSQVFKEMIQNNENKIPNEIIKILLPDSFKPSVFRELLRWIYSGKINEDLEINFLREMLLMADSLKIIPLQKILIVKYIIPNMTKEASIKFLKDSYKKSTTPDSAEVWTLLANFSLNCLSKNSSILIKNNRNEFLGMEMDLLFKCVEQSVFYLVEEIHLSNLIKLIIDRGFATDVFDLLIKLSKNYLNARNVHLQNIDISSLLSNLDPNQPIEYYYITDDCATNSQNESRVLQNITDNVNNSKSDSMTNTNKANNSKQLNMASVGGNNLELAKNKIEIIDVKKLNSNSPATNYVQDIDIKKNKAPTFSFSFTLNYENLLSCTIFSESFNTNIRSWNLKIDISENGDISVYLVERGMPIVNDHGVNLNSLHQDRFALKFNSVLFEFEIKDISFEKSAVIFFSFVSGHNQIVGFENFFNVKQLGKKENFYFNIWIKEFPLHSACLQYICDNFQNLAIGNKKKSSQEENERERENTNNQNNQINSNMIKDNSDQITLKTFYDLLPHDLTYILNSDNLRVENENTVLTVAYRFAINKSSADIDCVMNAIRYKFVELKLLCTTARDHDTIKNSNWFKKHFYKELERRINWAGRTNVNNPTTEKQDSNPNNNKINKMYLSFYSEAKFDSNKEKEEINLNQFNTNFISLPLRQHRERKFYVNVNDRERTKAFNITNELASFFLDKEHHSGYIKEIEKKLLEEEKSIIEKREAAFMLQKREMQMEIQRLNERENKRRKLTAAAAASSIENNPNNSNKTTVVSNIKTFATKCSIF